MSYDVLKIESKFSGLVGLRQPDDPEFFTLNPENLSSSSGLYVNDNPFAKLELLKDTQDYASIDAIQFNSKLTRVLNNSINAVVSSVFSGVGSQDYLDRSRQFKFPMNRINLETLPDGFVYEKIEVYEKENIGIEITNVVLDFEGVGDVELRLYSTAKPEAPVFAKVVTIDSKHQEVELNWRLDNTDGLIGGEFYLGYNNTSLTVTPFKRDYERSSIRSSYSCLRTNSGIIKGYTGSELWDLSSFDNISGSTGLNLDITVFNDYTDLAINNKELFAEAISMECQIQFINEYIASTRSNKNQRLSNQMVQSISDTVVTEDGRSFSKGLRPDLNAMINRVRKQIEKIERGYFKGAFNIVTLS